MIVPCGVAITFIGPNDQTNKLTKKHIEWSYTLVRRLQIQGQPDIVKPYGYRELNRLAHFKL